ncbi:ATP-dependent helicase [Legionella bozemanae]|uniref:ATP-dependent helicase n=1 Tax=Legionella bozemanae TaxID=447 RepID=UPI001041AB2A|nr:ATP-dependent helicase [Legionella bozemanae]
MAWDSNLRGSGLKIAGSTNKRICVMAGPGTGKSYVLMRRVARLLEDENVDPTRILAVTFTRTAAYDLITELKKIEILGCDKIDACTLHKFCYRLLLNNKVFDFLGRKPRPLLAHTNRGVYDHEIKPLLFDLMFINATSDQRSGSNSIRAYEAAWARQQIDKPGSPIRGMDQIFQKSLVSWLKFHRCMLIGEVVPEALKFIKNNPISEIFNSYDHILVDEYQDLDKAEQEFIDLLAKNCNLIVVGDEDQSIFSFRHAHPDGIIEFSTRHDGTENETLEECRRCPSNIVDLANNLILKNHSTSSPARLTPFPDNKTGHIKIIQWKTMQDEIKGIASVVNHLLKDKCIKPNEILILMPRKEMGYELREILENDQIPVHCFYNEAPVADKNAQENLCLLNLLVDKYDRVSLRFWLGCKSQTWLNKQYIQLRTYCVEKEKEPFDVMSSITAGEEKSLKLSDLSKRFKMLQSTLEDHSSISYRNLIDRLFPEGNEGTALLREMSLNWLNEHLENDQIEDTSINKLTELALFLRANIASPELPEEFDYVRIMSFHKSKGLTSRVVIIGGCVQGVIPRKDTKNIKEDRRLFYVALTRATEYLVISSFAQVQRAIAKSMNLPTHNGNKIYGNTIASEFLSEMGKNTPTSISGNDWKKENFPF